MDVTASLSLLMLMSLPAVAAQNQLVYFEVGKNLKLDPKYSEAITQITWKHKGNIVVDYMKNMSALVYLGDFKGRADLNLTTGTLTIHNMWKSDDGVFTVTLNTIDHPVRFKAVGVSKLDDYSIEVTVAPQGCSSHTSGTCSLVCGGTFEGAEPVQYFWKKGKTGQWKKGYKTITIFITKDIASFPHYTCKVKNPFSEKKSDPAANPFKRSTDSGPVPLPALLLVAVLAIGAAVIV